MASDAPINKLMQGLTLGELTFLICVIGFLMLTVLIFTFIYHNNIDTVDIIESEPTKEKEK